MLSNRIETKIHNTVMNVKRHHHSHPSTTTTELLVQAKAKYLFNVQNGEEQVKYTKMQVRKNRIKWDDKSNKTNRRNSREKNEKDVDLAMAKDKNWQRKKNTHSTTSAEKVQKWNKLKQMKLKEHKTRAGETNNS